jgi:hypothetical protein
MGTVIVANFVLYRIIYIYIYIGYKNNKLFSLLHRVKVKRHGMMRRKEQEYKKILLHFHGESVNRPLVQKRLSVICHTVQLACACRG